MDISKHVTRVREGIDAALSLADESTKDVASRVASAAEPSLRLALIDAITEAAAEINEELSTSHVTVALSSGDPSFVVQDRPYVADSDDFELVDEDENSEDQESELELDEEDADETLVRFSLRLPKWAKDKVDDRAERRGMSTNAYLTEVIIGEIAGGGWGQRGGRERFGPGAGFGGSGGGFGNSGGGFGGSGKGWGPGGLLDAQTAGHIANVLSEVFGSDPRRGSGPGRGRPGGRRGGHEHGRGPRGHGPRDGGSRDGGPRRSGDQDDD